MRFKIDENLPPEGAELLRQEGHEALTVFDLGLRSHTDPEVIAVCQAEGLALLAIPSPEQCCKWYPSSLS
jgi:predicted nuclease of predicted toxin-antitoxin system